MGTYTTNGTKSPTIDLSGYKNVSFTVNVPSADYKYYVITNMNSGYENVATIINNVASQYILASYTDSRIKLSKSSTGRWELTFLVSGYEYDSNEWTLRSANYKKTGQRIDTFLRF